MAETVVYAFYVWLLVSAVALIIQTIRRVRFNRARRQRQEQHASGSRPQTSAVRADDELVPATVGGPTVADQGGAAPSPTVPSPTAPSPTAPSPTAPSPTGGTAATPGATTSHTASSSSTPSVPAKAEPDAPQPLDSKPALKELLEGIRLPWGLLPTVDKGQPASDTRVSLLTNDADPGDVGAAVADELERLGYSVTAEADDRAVATRDGHVLGLRIIPDAAGDEIAGTRRFPDAEPTSVALDIWIRP